MIPPERIRNFSIVAHIDHGKSTLADRLLEATHTIDKRQMTSQVLDSMDLEREKGITIKARAVRLHYDAADGQTYALNLIDTPGHVDFTYEVSRSLQACEGAILVVDASQGIEAQTLANVHLAMAQNLTIIPVINKIDLPSADPEMVMAELEETLAIPREEVLLASAKDGTGVTEVLEAIVHAHPASGGRRRRAAAGPRLRQPLRRVQGRRRLRPAGRRHAPRPRAHPLHGDRRRVGDPRARLLPPAAGADRAPRRRRGRLRRHRPQEHPRGAGRRHADDGRARAPTSRCRATSEPLPLVFAGIYPLRGDDYPELRDALDKLHLNDAGFVYEPESSAALGFGFRCGFLGLLHMEIIQERLEREFDLDLIASAPSVEYRVKVLHRAEEVVVDNPAQMPDAGEIESISEPWVAAQVITPTDYIGPLMELATSRRGEFQNMEYLDPTRVNLHFEMPLGELIIDFYDQLKSRSSGYASLDYSYIGYRPGDLVKLDVLVSGEPVDALSLIVHRSNAYRSGQGAGREAQGADPAADVRGAGPGGHRLAYHQPRDDPGDAQERPGQVLRRRRDAQAQAAREAEGREAADEADRLGRDPAGGLPCRAAHERGRGPS